MEQELGSERGCWCGNRTLLEYSPEYLACMSCGTLVSRVGLKSESVRVADDEHDYYGKEYWLSRQDQDLGLPTILERARGDLPRRCLYWLRTLLAYKGPPAKVLELGSAHGGFVALLRWAGFDAAGLEVSPWVAEFARSAFRIPMLTGPIEEQGLEERSHDCIVLNDVLEHLPDPLGTLGSCVRVLKQDGILLVQTPEFPEGMTYAEILAARHPFLQMMTGRVAIEHLYLYGRRSAKELLARLGCGTLEFETACFESDMYFAASRQPIVRPAPRAIENHLAINVEGRLVLALLDKSRETDEVRTSWANAEADRVELMKMCRHIKDLSQDYDARLKVILQLQGDLAAQGAELQRHKNTLREQQSQIDRMQRSLPFRLIRLARGLAGRQHSRN